MQQKKIFILNNKTALIATSLLIIVTVWWLLLDPFRASENVKLVRDRYVWGASYQVIALFGALCGFYISRLWGGFSSVVGRSIISLSVGLLLQVFGQTVYSYYNLVAQIEAPYPSIGDIGYFGSIFAYLYGVIQLARASGVRISLKSFQNKALGFLLPILLLSASYLIFLQTYTIDWSQPITTILDFGYPLFQALYLSIAILVLFSTRKILGGLMRPSIIALLVALIVQYVADFNFLYQAHRGSWYVGGYGDMFYGIAYFCMTIALVYIGHMHSRIENASLP